MTSHRFVWPLAMLLFLGCSDPVARPGSEPEPDESDERLCPTCAVRAGGETGSFGRNPCDELREPIAEDDDSLGLTAAAVRPLLDREIETTLRWRAPFSDSPVPGAGDAPITLRVQTSDAFRVRSTPKDGVSVEVCRDRLEIEAEVTLSAEDGSIAGRFEAVQIEAESPEYANGWGEADLSTFRGSLDLKLDPERGPHMAMMEAGFTFYPGGIRGSLGVRLFYQDVQDPERWLPGGEPLGGRFPVDPCAGDERPIEPAETAGEGPFSEVIDGVRARIARQNPIAADWDGRAVELTFDLGETRDHCLSLRQVPGLLGARFTGHVDARSSDERLALHQATGVEVYLDRSGDFADVWLSLGGDPVPAEEFEDRFGLAGVDVQDSPCAVLAIENVYGQNEAGDFADGKLEVAGFACDPAIEEVPTGLEYADWCTQGTCTQPPRRSW